MMHSILILTEVQAGLGMKYAGLTAESSDSVRKVSNICTITFCTSLKLYR
jgi:hypothetical protein